MLRDAWPDAPHMAAREILLHAIRQALIARIWLIAARIPYFAPRHGTTRDTLGDQMLRLDIPAALAQLALIFPQAPDHASLLDFHEPRARQSGQAYGREHADIFRPIAEMFGLVRELGTAIMHEVGAFG
jgi:phosphoenolpyruvate carboxylase